MHDIFLHFKNNLSDTSRITYTLLSSSKLHASATADNLIRGIDRRIHAKTPDIFEILSTVQKVGLSMVYNCNRDMVWYINQHNNWDNTAPSANCPEVTFVCWLYTRGGGQRLLFKMKGTAVVLQLISFFFCCGKSLGKADSEPKRFTSARLVVLVTKTNSPKQFARHEGRAKCTCYKIQPSVLAVPLDTFSHFSVRSFHPVWQHSPVWLSIERDADRRGD